MIDYPPTTGIEATKFPMLFKDKGTVSPFNKQVSDFSCKIFKFVASSSLAVAESLMEALCAIQFTIALDLTGFKVVHTIG